MGVVGKMNVLDCLGRVSLVVDPDDGLGGGDGCQSHENDGELHEGVCG